MLEFDRYIKLAVVVALLSASLQVRSQPWHGYTTVTHLYPSFDGYFFLVSDALPKYSTCDNSRHFSIALNHINYDALVSALMAAALAGKEIRFNLETRVFAICAPAINRVFVKI